MVVRVRVRVRVRAPWSPQWAVGHDVEIGRFGLNFSCWSRGVTRARQIATRLQAGTININEGYIAAWGSVDAPMGGIKDSGMGRRHGATGILKYTEQQTVAVQRLVPLAPPPAIWQKLWVRLITAGLRLLPRAGLR